MVMVSPSKETKPRDYAQKKEDRRSVRNEINGKKFQHVTVPLNQVLLDIQVTENELEGQGFQCK